MNGERVLIVGGGGREHALAWRLRQSKSVEAVWVAPGNGGTWPDNVAADAMDVEGLLVLAKARGATLTVVGPEAPLGAGIVDRFTDAGMRCFGPVAAAARLETSKAFAKAFMARHGIATARYEVFKDPEAARDFVCRAPWPVVIKASGLAAGKGVLLPQSTQEAVEAIDELMVARRFGSAADEVVVEERLEGEEVSLLALCDGKVAVALVPARDHKRALDGDLGPNTGGMGAFAPTPALDAQAIEAVRKTVLQPVVDGMAAEGSPYIGVLYAGLMLTADGPKVLEFNCRFGDPETQVVLPLLEGDLAALFGACIDGTLKPDDVVCKPGAAATVVMASGGYPGAYTKGKVIQGIDKANAIEGVQVFEAGTRRDAQGTRVTSGGRVLAVTGIGNNLQQALTKAYQGVGAISFEGAMWRRDIGGGLGGQS